jgi:HD-GYP domain-containing protein (c-di-GMP phosphodiesterase class II)
MILNKLKKIFSHSLKLPVFLNTWNNRVIARKGMVFNRDLMEKAARMGKKFPMNKTPMENTFFIQDFQKLLQKDMKKYGFISENLKFLDDLTEYVAQVQIPEQIVSELEWIKKRFTYNYHHIVAVTALSTRIARDFFLEEEDILKTAEAAILYDIGVGHIPLNIIQKLGRLNEDERNIIHYHPVYSALLIAHYYQDPDCPLLDPILNHHENMDGSGYPRGVKNKNILSHIIKLSDTFDALISARPFRKYYTTRDAFKICEDLIKEEKITPEILPIIYSYYFFIDQYPHEKGVRK